MKTLNCSRCRKPTKHEFVTHNLSGKGLGAEQVQFNQCVKCGNKRDVKKKTNYTDKNWNYKLRMRVPKMPK
jgi:sulfur relay (sulfurtransferase) complex TusBCD TusD component (DsrE family)